jgi:hypothetical protein
MQDTEHRVELVPGIAAQPMNHPMMPRALRERQTGLVYLEKRQTGGGACDKTAKNHIVNLGWTTPEIRLDKLSDQLGGNDGQFCYVYV